LAVSDPVHRDLTTDRDGHHRLTRILYCTDFSNNSERARGYAISLAAEYGAELTLLHVAQSAPDLARAEVIIAERTQELGKLVSET
jgi:nucleotide-binding universal stress UspA family protein